MDKSEIKSFLDPNKVFSAAEVPDAMVDVRVQGTQLEIKKAVGDFQNIGRWYGPSGVAVASMTFSDTGDLETTLTDSSKIIIPEITKSYTLEAEVIGTGLLTSSGTYPSLFNEEYVDWYDQENDLMYVIGSNPNVTSKTPLLMQFANGLKITASSTWNTTNYTLEKAFNRKVDHTSDGLLGATQLTVTFEFPVGQPAEIAGYRYKNLRSDYRTNTYMMEYQAPGSDEWLPLDTQSPGLTLNTIIYETPVLVKAIRWRSLTFTSAPGIGQLDLLQHSPKNRATFKPINFLSSHFNRQEDLNGVTLTPIQVGEIVTEPVVPLNFSRYSAAKFIYDATNTRYELKTNSLFAIPLNKVVADNNNAFSNLPYIHLKKGRWYVKLKATSVLSARSRLFLGYRGTNYPVGDVFATVVQDTNLRSNQHVMEGPLDIHSDVDVSIVFDSDGIRGLTQRNPNAITPQPVVSIELWHIDDVPEEPAFTGIKPSAELIPAPFRHYGGTLNFGNGSQLFDGLTASATPQDTGYWYYSTDHVIVGVFTPFRIWRRTRSTAGGPIAPLRVIKLDGGAYELPSAHKPISKVGANEWELMTFTLPAGIYKFLYSGERNDAEWFIEKQPLPAEWEFGNVATRVTLPMTAAVDAGQTVTTSSAFSASYAGYLAFTSIPSGNGWISSANSQFGAQLQRVNAAMTATPQNGQTATWSSAVSSSHTGLEALGAAVSPYGWTTPVAPTVADPAWLKLEFVSAVTFDTYSITNRNYSVPVAARSWFLEVSNDGVQWTTVHTVNDDMRDGQAVVRQFELAAPVTAKFVRLSITKHHPGTEGFANVSVGQFLIGAVTVKGEWLNVAFDSPQRFSKYKFTNRNYPDTNASHAPRSWQLLGRLSGGEWQVLHSVENDTRNAYGLTREFDLGSSVLCDEVRLNITGKTNGTGGEAAYAYVCVQHFQLETVDKLLNEKWL